MTIFDLIFLLAVATTALTLAVAAALAIRGHRALSMKILVYCAAAALLYILAGIGVAYLRPQRVLQVGEPWCFDDWCLTVEHLNRTPDQLGLSYRVDLRVFSRARRVSQRARGAWVFLIDDRGTRYSPDADPSAVPLDVLLQPGGSVRTSRVFRVPSSTRGLGLITGHGGAYCGVMSFLVIGESGCLFNKPTMIRVQ
ncbi:MAG TPA: hypothetical protein VLX32_12675 [Candidatus Acidoferrum sp.]|nr:hypothetical protein [Candidatus Acidoferrum sp.]